MRFWTCVPRLDIFRTKSGPYRVVVTGKGLRMRASAHESMIGHESGAEMSEGGEGISLTADDEVVH